MKKLTPQSTAAATLTPSVQASRRALLQSALALGGTALLAACEGNDAGLIQGEGGTSPPVGSGLEASTGGGDAGLGLDGTGDAQALNALLALEYAAIDAYAAGAGILAAPAKDDPLAALAPVLLAIANHFHDQHVAHAEALENAITASGGEAIATSSIMFTAPAGFTPSVTNVLKLACNAERAAALSYVGAISSFTTATNRFLAANTSGDETQHFMVLYAVLKGTVGPGPNLDAATASQLVPEPFVSAETGAMSLEDIPDFDLTM